MEFLRIPWKLLKMHLPQVSSVRTAKVTVGELAAVRASLEPFVTGMQVKGYANVSGNVGAIKMKVSALF